MFADDDDPQAATVVGAEERTARDSRVAAAVVATAGRHRPHGGDCSELFLVMLFFFCSVFRVIDISMHKRRIGILPSFLPELRSTVNELVRSPSNHDADTVPATTHT